MPHVNDNMLYTDGKLIKFWECRYILFLYNINIMETIVERFYHFKNLKVYLYLVLF